MKTSETIADLAQALCEFQSTVVDAHKGAQGHNYRYADLGTILQLVRPLMAAQGLSVVQMPCGDAITAGLTTRLMHTSGEWVEDTMHMGVTASRGMSEAQAAGSVITYMRRYSLAAVLGITQTDDDAVVKEPEIVPATQEQFATINKLIEDKKMPVRTMSWLKAGKNWDNLTSKQAINIISQVG
jgi:hypothetical protein